MQKFIGVPSSKASIAMIVVATIVGSLSPLVLEAFPGDLTPLPGVAGCVSETGTVLRSAKEGRIGSTWSEKRWSPKVSACCREWRTGYLR